MKMKRVFLFAAALAAFAAFTLAACSGGAAGSPVGEWRLVSYGPTASQTPAAMGVDTNINFASNGQVMGNVGCNSFSGDYRVNGSQITFEPIISTLMACEDPIGTQEAEVFRVFASTVSFQVNEDSLTVTTADGASAVVLERK